MANGFLILSTGLVLLAGCSSAEQKTERTNQTIQSWKATVQLTSQLRESGAVPEQYARQTLDVAAQELEMARQRLKEISR
jgi:hypothetical protein